MSNLPAQTGLIKSNKLLHEKKLWAQNEKFVARHYHKTIQLNTSFVSFTGFR